MKLLTPLGLLGLLGIAVLILIYVIKPNYQQKTVSSTFVWKLSLKYKKKRVQINKLRNVLLILCQVLVLTACALILAEPNRVVKAETDPSEVIAIIDSSASMRAQKDGESRFERAVKKSLSLSEEVFSNGGLFSVILADENPSFLLNRISAAEEDKVSAALEELLEEDACTYGASNMDAAIKLSENILNENPKAQIYLYTDTTYSYVPSTVNLVSVSETGEWNVGILNARAEMEDNYYAFYVDLACYGQDIDVKLTVSVSGPNTSSSTENVKPTEFETIVKCSKDKTKTVIFKNENEVGKDTENTVYVPIPDQKRIYSYQSVHIYVSDSETATSSLNDSFSEDNTMYYQFLIQGYLFDNVIGELSINTVYDEAGAETETYFAGTFGQLSGIYDINGKPVTVEHEVLSEEEASPSQSGLYMIEFELDDGYTYRIRFELEKHEIFGVYAYHLYAFTRVQQMEYGDYSFEVERVVATELNSLTAGSIFTVSDLKKNGESVENENSVTSVVQIDGVVYYIVREKDDAGKITSTVYYKIELVAEDAGTVPDTETEIIGAYESATVTEEQITTISSADGKSFIDVTSEDKVFLVSVNGSLFGVKENISHDEATGIYTVVLYSNETLKIEVKDGVLGEITVVEDTEESSSAA